MGCDRPTTCRRGLGFLCGRTRPPIEVIIVLVDENRDGFGVEFICASMQMAPSTYYAAKKLQTTNGRLRSIAFLLSAAVVAGASMLSVLSKAASSPEDAQA